MIKELKLEIQAVMNRQLSGEINAVDAAIVVMELQSSIIRLLEQRNSSLSPVNAEQGSSADTVLKVAA